MTVVTPWTFDGVAQRVPEELGVVVGVRVDEAGRDDQAVGVERPSAAVLVDARRSATMRPSRTPTSATRRGRAGAVDDVPPLIR